MTPAEALSALQLAYWRLELGDQPPEDLVGLAVDALVTGLDGPALAELAGMNAADVASVREVFGLVAVEQGLERSNEQAAIWQLVRHTARQIVDGTLEPIEGARWLWREASYRAEPEGDLRVFEGLASEADGHPDDRAQLSHAVVQEAVQLLARETPRRWLRVQADPERALSVATTRGQTPVTPIELGLSSALAARVAAWSQAWQQNLDEGGFASAGQAEAFVEDGRLLAKEIQRSIGSDWNVEYYPEPTRSPGLQLRPS